MLLNRERQFTSFSPEFAKGMDYPYENFSSNKSQAYASTMETKQVGTRGVAVVRKSKSDRRGGWDPKTLSKGNSYDDDLNDRETVDYGEPPAGVRTALPHVQQQAAFRQPISVRQAPSQSHFVNSAKMQFGSQLQGSLHNTVGLPENPLLGISEGERQRKLYKEEFMKFALSGAEGSLITVKERSRSKSRRARYEAQKQQQATEESFVDIMNRTKQQYQPNRLAMKQRYTYSPKGQIARAGSAELIRAGSDERKYQNQPSLNQNLNGEVPLNFRIQNTNVQSPSSTKVIDIGGAQTAPDMLEREQKKAEYRAILFAQMNEKNEKKRQTKVKESEDDARLMNEYAMHYRIGALKQGGGSPIRDRNGDVVTQHYPFTSQVQHNGGVEDRGDMSNIYENRPTHQPDPTTSFGQQFGTSFRPQDYSIKVVAGSTYSPKKQEIMHMKPSNMFEDITEEEFNKREQDKKAYQNELMSQMREAKEKKLMEKERIQRQEMEDERKIHAALAQMGEAFRKEENKGNQRDERAASTSSISQHGPRGILKGQERSQSNSRLQVHKPPSSNHNVSMAMPMSNPDGYDQMNINIEPDYYQQPYRQRPLSNIGTSNLGTYHGSAVHDEQMERLRRVQQEIEIKTTQDRIETEKIFRDLVDSNKKLSNILQQSSPYSLRNFPQPKIKMSIEPTKFDTQAMSGNIRLESQYLRLISSPVQPKFSNSYGGENGPYEGRLTPNRQNEPSNKVLGGPSANLAAARDSYQESAIGKLDALIGDFQKNN